MRAFTYNPPTRPYLDIVHVDEEILVLSKPSGLLSVPGKASEHADCLEARAQQQYQQARIVHRLDMDTSGIIIMAMNAKAHRHLGLQFERRKVKKLYEARVQGIIEADRGEIDLPLICDWPNRPRQMVDHERGKTALTRWRVLQREPLKTRVELAPFTGRSHQLRVHMLAIGHPILGDNLYADDDAFKAADRLQLHAKSLSLHHPADGRLLSFFDRVPF